MSKASASSQEQDCLLIFSSSTRRLYYQNVLDTLAAPPEARRTFRYQQRWLGSGCSEKADRESLRVRNIAAMSFFSIQQESEFSDAVFIPVRMGRLVATNTDGPFVFFTIAVDRFVAFVPSHEGSIAAVNTAVEPGKGVTPKLVHSLRTFLAARYEREFPYDRFATVAPGFLDSLRSAELIRASDEPMSGIDLFVRTADYLSRTETFRDAFFLRFLELRELSGQQRERLPDPSSGRFSLTGGRDYELALLQYRPGRQGNPVSYRVGYDSQLINVIGGRGFDAAAGYDRISIRFNTVDRGAAGDFSTAIQIEPEQPGALAPTITIDILVKPPRSRTSASVGSAFTLVTVFTSLIANQAWIWWVRALVIAGLLGALSLVLYLSRFRLSALTR